MLHGWEVRGGESRVILCIHVRVLLGCCPVAEEGMCEGRGCQNQPHAAEIKDLMVPNYVPYWFITAVVMLQIS